MNATEKAANMQAVQTRLATEVLDAHTRLILINLLAIYHSTHCDVCGNPLLDSQEQVLDTYGDRLVHAEPCYAILCEDAAKQQAQEQEAERRNEEALYGYELRAERGHQYRVLWLSLNMRWEIGKEKGRWVITDTYTGYQDNPRLDTKTLSNGRPYMEVSYSSPERIPQYIKAAFRRLVK